MPFSHKCQICDKTLNADSVDALVDRTEEHLLDHVESKIELTQEFFEEFDQESSEAVTETQLRESQLNAELLEGTNSDDSSGLTEMGFTDYENIADDNYSEEEQYGEERYILDSMEPMNET